MDGLSDIKALFADDGKPDAEILRRLVDRYRFFSFPAVLLLRDHSDQLDEEELKSLRGHVAVITGDRKALYDMATAEGASFAGFYPEKKQKDIVTTESAIETFFANYGSEDSAETALLERLIFNPAPDYAELLAREESHSADSNDELPADSQDARIDAFIRKRQAVERQSVADVTEPAVPQITEQAKPQVPEQAQPPVIQGSMSGGQDDSLLSESLARIFVKQGRYERAYEIISNLSLNYPKKSIYFADQLRFLQKLIKIKQAAVRGSGA